MRFVLFLPHTNRQHTRLHTPRNHSNLCALPMQQPTELFHQKWYYSNVIEKEKAEKKHRLGRSRSNSEEKRAQRLQRQPAIEIHPPSPDPMSRPMTASGRPTTGSRAKPPAAKPPARPAGTAMGRPTTGMQQRIGTAATRGRVGTAMAAPGSSMGRPGTRGGGSGYVNVAARPVTQQGLQGVRPMSTRGGNRQVLDKSYYLGLLRSKMTELSNEISRLNKETQHYTHESQNMAVYEKRAEEVAVDIDRLRAELADYNTLVDRMNTSVGIDEMEREWQQLKEQNDAEAQNVDALFAERRQKEEEAKELETRLTAERGAAEDKLNSIDPASRERYDRLKQEHARLTEEVQAKEQELEELGFKLTEIETDLAANPIKQEAMHLYEQLTKTELKRDGLKKEIEDQGTPEQEREKLLEKVKKDNQDVATMEREIADVRERLEQIQEEMLELEQEFEEHQGENNEKYRELKIKEQQMDEFLNTYEEVKMTELERVHGLEKRVVNGLAAISKVVDGGEEEDEGPVASKKGASPEEELQQLQEHIATLEQSEETITMELEALKAKLSSMSEEANQYEHTEGLEEQASSKREALESEKSGLAAEMQDMQERLVEVQRAVSEARSRLASNEQHKQIVSLEDKLSQADQSNFALREAIETKRADTDVGPLRQQAMALIAEYNSALIAIHARMRSVAQYPRV